MHIKKLAYLKIKLIHSNDEFCETYTFLKPTVLYLPHGLIITIKEIEKNKLCLIVTSYTDNTLCEKVTLSLCGKRSKKIIIDGCYPTTLCLKLDEINILKPCYKQCSSDCLDDCCDNDCL
ncbi:MAG: hypothetical protein RR847_04470 [Bacilli bacterium]